MKTYLLVLVSLLVVQPFGRSQVIVHDPPLAELVGLNHTEEMLKLDAIIEETRATKEWLGNPVEILDLAGWSEVAASLETVGLGRSRVDIAVSATSAEGAAYDGDGVFVPVRESFVSRDGKTILRPDVFKPEATIFNAVRDHDAVYEDVMTRRESLRWGMQQTLSQLQMASTHAEVQKATGVLVSQHAELDAVDRELIFAAQKVVLLDVQNRADKERQEKARQQEQAHEFGEALHLFSKAMCPPMFVPHPQSPHKGEPDHTPGPGIAPTP